MDPHVVEWLNLVIRWGHVITGVAWIGASFYFNWLENNLDRSADQKPGIAGHLWAIHGGGFYYLEKYDAGPETLPKELHWFKWEAYFTWITGFALLAVVYYLNAEALLIDPLVADLTPTQAVLLSLLVLLFGWLIYDFLCRTSLASRAPLFGCISLSLIIAAAWGLSQVFSARAAFIHLGAMLGTLMVANVFRIIIPSQKRLVDSVNQNSPIDPTLGAKALQRSRHNNYLTLPVLLIMVSNHFPVIFGHRWNWVLLSALVLIGMLVRYWFNIRGRGWKINWILPLSIGGLVLLAVLSRPSAPDQIQQEIGFTRVSGIIANRCLSCHSAHPTDDTFKVAPNGLMFDTPQQIKNSAAAIKSRTVATQTMPLANKTQMTEAERQILGAWIDAGASLGF